jgi:uncharacterized lipoprotein YddW (UPF0748 family)
MTSPDRRQFLQVASLAGMAATSAAASGATETRATWFHPLTDFSSDSVKGKEEVHVAVQRLAEANFNLLLPWTSSDYLAALDDPGYREKVPAAGWDMLAVLLEEAKAAGLRVDMWYSFSDYKTAQSPEFEPRVGGNPQWAARRAYETVPDPRTGQTVPRRVQTLCSLHPDARQWVVRLIGKALDRYPQFRGLHIEEPGYAFADNCVCDLCKETFTRVYGGSLMERITTQQAEDLRNVGPSAFVDDVRDLIGNRRPRLFFSTNGGNNWRNDRRRGRDWGRWTRSGWFDAFFAQCYTPDPDRFKKNFGVTMKDIAPDCPVYAGIAFRWSSGKNTVEEMVHQVETAREMGAGGFSLFHARAFTDELLAALRKGPFRNPARLPEAPAA